MDQLPYDNLEELTLLLQAVFSGDTLTIKHANEVLHKMAGDPLRFTDSMMNIVVAEPTQSNYLNIQKSAATSICRILSPFISNKKTSVEQKQYILEAVVKAMYSINVPPTIKLHLQQFLQVIFHSDQELEFSKKSLILAQTKLLEGQLNDYGASLFIINAMLENPSAPQESLAEWFLIIWESLVISCDAIIEGIGKEIMDILTVKEGDHSQRAVNVYMASETLKVWARIICDFVKHLGRTNARDMKKRNHIEVIIDKEQIARLVLKMLVIHIPTQTQIRDCLISTCNYKMLDKVLNSVKTIGLKTFVYILEYMEDAQLLKLDTPLLNEESNKFYKVIHQDGIKVILQSLFSLCNSNYGIVENGLKDEKFLQCLAECLTIITKLISFQTTYPIFSVYKQMIIMNICLPLIASTKEELAMFESDPQAFVSLTTNVEEDLDTENPKIQAILLLKKLSINIDGCLSSLVMLLVMLIDYSLSHNDLQKIGEKYPKLVDYRESVFLTAIEARVRVETCLLILADQNEQILAREDLISVIERLFSKYQEYFLSPELDPLIKCRLCLFMGSHMVALFDKETNYELYIHHLKYLVECAGISAKNQLAVSEQANQTLYEMLAEKQSLKRMAPLITEIFEKLGTFAKGATSVVFFDVLYEIIRIYKAMISKKPEIFMKVLSELVERATEEFKALETERGLAKTILNKVWSIVKVISDKKEYMQYQEDIERILLPMFTHLASDEDLPFDDEILHYISNTIKLTTKVSPLAWDVFKVLPQMFRRARGLITPLFQALNQYIVHGQETIKSDNETIHELIEMGVQGINPSNPEDTAGTSVGALFFQLMIQYIGIQNEEWERMLRASLEKLKESEEDFVRSRLSGVFLLAFLRDFAVTEACLEHNKGLGYVLDTFLNQPMIFNTNVYDRKVYLIGLCGFLKNAQTNPNLIESLPAIFDILVSYLVFVQHIEQKYAKKKSLKNKKKKEYSYNNHVFEEGRSEEDMQVLKRLLDNTEVLESINPNELDRGDSDEESSDDEEEIYFPTERDEANYYVSNMISAIKTEDEFAAFRDTFTSLKQSNPELLEKLGMSLPEKKRELMKEILHSRRIVLSHTLGQTEARKVVKPLSRKVADVKMDNQ